MGGGVSTQQSPRGRDSSEATGLSSEASVNRRTFQFLVQVERAPEDVLQPGRTCFLRICPESLDVLQHPSQEVLQQFPYQSILCWGHDHRTFQFKVFPLTLNKEGTDPINLSFVTKQGAEIEVITMSTVRELMASMEKQAVTRDDFKLLKHLLLDPHTGLLVDDWMKILEQFATGRSFLAKQGMELVQFVSGDQPFERIDLACFLFEHLLHTESFQLILNWFTDPTERDNIAYRCKIENPSSLVSAVTVSSSDASV